MERCSGGKFGLINKFVVQSGCSSFHVQFEPIEGQGSNMERFDSVEIWEFLVMHNTLNDDFVRVKNGL